MGRFSDLVCYDLSVAFRMGMYHSTFALFPLSLAARLQIPTIIVIRKSIQRNAFKIEKEMGRVSHLL